MPSIHFPVHPLGFSMFRRAASVGAMSVMETGAAVLPQIGRAHV